MKEELKGEIKKELEEDAKKQEEKADAKQEEKKEEEVNPLDKMKKTGKETYEGLKSGTNTAFSGLKKMNPFG